MQKRMHGCWTRDFDKILFTYSKSKSLNWIYEWTHWATRWQPAQFRQVGSLPSNHTRIDSSGLLTVQVYWQPGPPIWQRLGLDPDPDPKWWSGTSANTSMDEVGHREVGHNAGNMLKQLNPRWTWHNESLASAALVLASLSILYKLWSHRGCCSWGGT